MINSKIFDYIDPIIFSIGSFDIKWYAIAYIAGILLGEYYTNYLVKKFTLPINKIQIQGFLTWLILGIILGGRLGYVIFYNPIEYFNNPIEILKTWEGGLSFHGAVIGVVISTIIFSRIKKLSFLLLLDLISTSAPIGIFFGRCANFINQELVGRVTDSPLGIIFPGYNEPRHPSQLYEALFEGLILFCIMFISTFRYKSILNRGLNSGIAMFCYGIFRIAIENFRDPDTQLGFIFSNITMGQLQTIPLLIVGIFMIYRFK
jgi:phosphatidylglycerol:prolipoprotein diacylglycerol transferase